jgi:hypothetical protein
VSYISFITLVDEKFHSEWPWSVVGIQQIDSQVRYAGGCPLLHIPTPDYSTILPRVDCWRRKPRNGDGGSEVSCAVACSVVQI